MDGGYLEYPRHPPCWSLETTVLFSGWLCLADGADGRDSNVATFVEVRNEVGEVRVHREEGGVNELMLTDVNGE